MLPAIHQKPIIARYRLKTRGFLKSISNRREFEGALIRIAGGYGCIHPWPELGDPTLENVWRIWRARAAGPSSGGRFAARNKI